MSCRVFNRDVETLILNHLKSTTAIRGEYRPTERNQLCANVYAAHNIPSPAH
jgi:predicted enzyme involved in methoxymalonyl-ACP biosynthesis